jgi:hypothetical protein
MALATGDRLGPYEILALIGAGGMGAVYRARDTRLGREVALKILPADVANDSLRRQRFELEARAVAALNHPNIVAVYDVGNEDGVFYIVSELVDGEPLRGAKLGLNKTLDIAAQIAGGLAAAHDAGIVHRDLKPDNVLLTRDGRVKILDFGLAKVASGKGAASAAGATETLTVHTEPGVVMGTSGYMSPEQVRAEAVDHRSDIFSLGLILYELLVGRRAFQGDTSVETMTAILRQETPELPETVPAGVRQIVAHCLEKDAGNRFQSARDLRFALSAMAQTGSHSAPATAPAAPNAWGRRVLAAAVLIAAGVAGTLLLWRAPPSPVWTGVLLGGPEVSMNPRPSPDGHWLAFIAVSGEIQQVAVMKPESGNLAILTHASDKGYVESLSWSADGTKIYYDRQTDVPRGIYSVPVLGGEEQLVVEDVGSPEALPDGSLLVGKLNAARQYQVFRYWPETGRWQAFPLEMSALGNGVAKSFPDGREAVAIGTPIGPGRETGAHLYAIDLESGKLRRLTTGLRDDSKTVGLAVARDGKSILAAISSGNVEQITAIPRSGGAAVRGLFTLTNMLFSLDAGPEGSIYLDQIERRVDLVRFAAQGGPAEKIATMPAYEEPGAPWGSDESFAVLPDGRAVLTQGTGGRMRLMVVAAGKDPVPLVATGEENSAPVTAAGPGEIAFLIGQEPRRTIAMAALSNGRITRRIPFDKGPITSLASSPDGKVLYCAAGGMIWSIPVAGGVPRKVRAGDHVAVDPAGENLLVEVVENPVIRLIHVPLGGGAEREVPRTGALRPAFMIGPNAIGNDGRILTPLGTSTWYWPPGVIDPRTGAITRIPVDYTADYHGLGWTPDGKVMGVGLELRAKMWKFDTKGR